METKRQIGYFLKMRFNAVAVVFVLFGLLNAWDVIQAFGVQAVDLPPVQFFFRSLWVAFRNFIGYSLLPVALVFFLGRRSRLILIPTFCFFVIEAIAATYTYQVFRASLAAEWLPLLLNTSVREVCQFVGMVLTPVVGVGLFVLLALLVFCSILIWRARYPGRSLENVNWGVASVIPFIVFNCILINLHFGVNQMRYTHFIFGGYFAWVQGSGIRNACLTPNLPECVKTMVATNELPDCIFVLGESATRNDWHLFGYSRRTTPRMDEICREQNGGFAFSDVLSIVPVTDRALALLLTDVTFDNLKNGNWSVAEAFRRAGYTCVLISNQWDGESEASTLDIIFNGCARRISVPKVRASEGHSFDEHVVPLLTEELRREKGPKAVFIHLAGMHYPVQNVIPKKEKHYTDEIEGEGLNGLSARMRDRINRYDDAILYEDKVLGQIVDVLKKNPRPTCMMFISDHGESPWAEDWRIYTDPAVYEVPMVIWLSEKYRECFPKTAERVALAKDRPFQSDELTDGVLELGQLEPLPNRNGKSFLSSEFRGRNPRFIDKGRIIYRRKGE